MPRSIVKTPAVVLRTQRMSESSKLATLYTEGHGKLKVIAKGARRPRSKFGGALELMTEMQAVCYVRDERDLQILSDGDVVRAHPVLARELERLAFGSAACELIDAVTIEGEANRRLYRCLTGVLAGLEEVDRAQLEPLFWYYQLRVVEALGYRPELGHCVSCGQELAGAWLWFSAARGGGACPACGPQAGTRVAGSTLRFLAQLQGLDAYRREAIPPVPERRGEVRAVLRAFLEYHIGRHGPLRALDFLAPIADGIPSSARGETHGW
ncbi:MAG: DNA repair protein RecO [Candidatus Latescibacterota bacterium]